MPSRCSLSPVGTAELGFTIHNTLRFISRVLRDADAGARMSPGLQRLLSLVGAVEGGCIRLHQLQMRHPLLGTTALRQQVYSHYMRAALPELVKLLGSANLLGGISGILLHTRVLCIP